jgi:hypothetical protein
VRTRGTASGWKNRRYVSTLDPDVYQTDRIGFLKALRAIHRAADLGRDTRNSYLIVENNRVVGIGGCGPARNQKPVRDIL